MIDPEWYKGEREIVDYGFEPGIGAVPPTRAPTRAKPGPGPRKTGAARPSARRTVKVNVRESPLGWLKAHDLISDRLFRAGEQLRADYERASIAPSITMRWEARAQAASGGRPAGDPTLAQLAARDRFDQAMAAAGAGLRDVLWRVVCAGDTVPCAERALGWPTRSGRLVLTLALERIADFYRLR